MNLKTILMSAVAFAALAACTPAAETPVATPPAPADIAAVTPESGPAAENTADTLSSAPTEAAAPAAIEATPPAAPAAAAGPTKEELANGASVYARTCAMCHGPTGAGTVMGVGLTAGHEYEVIKEKIIKGPINSGDKMPPLGAAMSPDDLDDVAKYVEAGLPQ